MDCDVCGRPHHPTRLPFLCPTDARNHLYDGRVKTALALLENEGLRKQIEELAEVSPLESARDQAPSARIFLSEQQALTDKTNRFIEQADKLRGEIAASRGEVEKRKAALARRRNELASASNGLTTRRAKYLDEAQRSIQTLRHRWNRGADALTNTRAFLCLEAAKLFGLRRLKTGSHGSTRYRYTIGGVDVIDLETMHAASPEQLSTSLANVSHILALASHYLSVRLPAELTLPHRDYPRPTIFTLSSSYQHAQVPFPGSAPIPGLSAEDDLNSQRHIPRPRPLYIDKALPQLAKEDPAVYSLLLEGVTLLAYDVAWMCNTQGVSVGDRNSFEDVCHIGRNLYNLLIGNHHHVTQPDRATPLAFGTGEGKSNGHDEPEDVDQAKSLMGRYSHGAAHTFLGGADGVELVRGFKLPSPVKLADRLRKSLMNEVAIPEWEVLEEDAWAGGDGSPEGGIVVIGDKKSRQEEEHQRHESGKAEQALGIAERDPQTASASGTSGWTKVKNR